MERYIMSGIGLITLIITFAMAILVYQTGKNRNWKSEDEEQMKYIKSHMHKHTTRQ